MPYNLRGTVYNDNAPEGGWTVRLLQHSDGSFVEEDITGSSGEFEFLSVDNISYDLYAFDDSQPELGDGDSPYSKNLHIGVMPVHEPVTARYWRLVNIDVAAGGSHLEISELRLFSDGVDVTANATISSSVSPDGFTLADLVDGNTNTRCFWTNNTAEDPSFWIQFDFGAGDATKVNGLKQAGFDTNNRYMAGFTVQFSDDGVSWTPLGTLSGLTYPGNNTLSSLYEIDPV